MYSYSYWNEKRYPSLYGYYICDCAFITLHRSLGSSDRFVDVSNTITAAGFLECCYVRASFLRMPCALSRFLGKGGVPVLVGTAAA
jgi:hypothetical protein